MMVVGASDSGKSRFLQHLIRQDLREPDGAGVMVLDPHGTLYDDILSYSAYYGLESFRKFHLIDARNADWSIGINPLSTSGGVTPDAIATGLRDAFCRVWGEDLTDKPGVEEALGVVFYTLAANNLTLLETTEITELHQQQMLEHLGDTISDPMWKSRVRHFLNLAGNRQTQHQFEMQMGAVGRRIARFYENEFVRNMVGQTEGTLDLYECMQHGDVVLVNLGLSDTFSLDKSRMLGTVLLNDVYNKSFRRTEESGRERPFYVYVDEAHRFLSPDIRDTLFELRKFGTHLILAFQDLGQLDDAGGGIKSGVLQGAQTKIVFGGAGIHARELAELIYRGEIEIEQGVEATRARKVVGYERVIRLGGSDSQSESETIHAEGQAINSESFQSTYSWQETDRPILEESYTQVHNVETLLFDMAAKMDNLPVRHAVVKARGEGAVTFRVPDVEDVPRQPVTDLPERFTKSVLEASEYAKPISVVRETIANRLSVLNNAKRINDEPDSYLE